ncbi:MAG: hypothetical protein KME30_06655 [Iphinoe sp. HA4291-MV1]|nr:hypothetical protein [Iphinoe sp. HA4291-MV1]
MGNGQWAMGNGQWAMGNGRWAMGNGQKLFFSSAPVLLCSLFTSLMLSFLVLR